MSFADIIRQEQERLENQNSSNDRVEYAKTKHKRLFFEKGNKDLFIQILPAADLVSAFAVPVRKIILQTKSSKGKDILSTFYLDPERNPGSLLEQKIEEWAEKGMIPSTFGGQTTPRRVYLMNVVKIINVNGQYVQERDEQGNLVVRIFEMPQSGYSTLIRKLMDPLYNTSKTELSFMDVNKPLLLKISKPAKGQMEYQLEVYPQIQLPPLGQGWENQLEDLNAHAVPTERLVNGDKWVQAFIDMKEGRKPHQGQGYSTNTDINTNQPTTNPYANTDTNTNTNVNTNINTGPTVTENDLPFNFGPSSDPNPNPSPNLNVNVDMPSQAPTQPNVPTGANLNLGVPEVTAPPQQPQEQPQHTQTQQQPQPTHAVNNNGLMDIDALLAKELGNL